MKWVLMITFLSFNLIAAPLVSGKLTLSKELTAKAKGIRTVYISILDPQSPMPMPCAAQKFTLVKDAEGSFLDFTVDSDQAVMMACAEIPAEMNLKVKLDKDGNAGRDSSGDIVGVKSGVKKGAKGIAITLDKATE